MCVYTSIHSHTHKHTLLSSSVVTSWSVTRALLTVQSFTDDQAVTLLLEQEDGMCERSQPYSGSGYNERETLREGKAGDHESSV